MKKYPSDHWKALGAEVNAARLQAGYIEMSAWVEAVGRSSRILLGLERGEPVGAKTIEAIAETLGMPNWALFQILDTGDRSAWPGNDDAEVEQARVRYERETGRDADGSGRNPVQMFSDEELLAEVARRMAMRPESRSERRLREVRERWESDEPAADIAARADPTGRFKPSDTRSSD